MSREAGAAVIVRELEQLVRWEREREKSGKTRESRRPGDQGTRRLGHQETRGPGKTRLTRYTR